MAYSLPRPLRSLSAGLAALSLVSVCHSFTAPRPSLRYAVPISVRQVRGGPLTQPLRNKSDDDLDSVDSFEGPKGDTSPGAMFDATVEGDVLEGAAAVEKTEEKKSLLGRVKGMYKGKDDGLTFRQRLTKMGMSVLLSYGFVSNMSYCVTVSLAWFGFSKKTGLSPLAPGQWKGFLAVYAGFYVFNNIIRPIRLTLSVGVSKYFDAAVKSIQDKTKLSRGVSIALLVFLANFCGTLAGMALGISIASTLASVPIFPPKT